MNKAQDLSVEEILNSIRGVINNHSSRLNKKPEVNEDILELTEERIAPANGESEELGVKFEANDALRDFADRAARYEVRPSVQPNGKAVEELVAEILKPEINKWLSNNLPALVKQLVEKEIRRLTNQK
jgi:cell pole-organizing protein PopZ